MFGPVLLADCVSGQDDPRVTNMLDLQLRAPHTCTGPGQDQCLQDVFSCLVLKLPSKGAALEVSCRSCPCCKVFSGGCSVVVVSSLSLPCKGATSPKPRSGFRDAIPQTQILGACPSHLSRTGEQAVEAFSAAGTYSRRLSAGLVVSAGSDSASCQVTFQHPSSSPPIPFPRVLQPAALRNPRVGWDRTSASPRPLPGFERLLSPTGFAAVFSASAGH